MSLMHLAKCSRSGRGAGAGSWATEGTFNRTANRMTASRDVILRALFISYSLMTIDTVLHGIDVSDTIWIPRILDPSIARTIGHPVRSDAAIRPIVDDGVIFKLGSR